MYGLIMGSIFALISVISLVISAIHFRGIYKIEAGVVHGSGGSVTMALLSGSLGALFATLAFAFYTG